MRIERFNRAVDRLIKDGFVFKGASGIAYRQFMKVEGTKTTWAFLLTNGRIEYKVVDNPEPAML